MKTSHSMPAADETSLRLGVPPRDASASDGSLPAWSRLHGKAKTRPTGCAVEPATSVTAGRDRRYLPAGLSPSEYATDCGLAPSQVRWTRDYRAVTCRPCQFNQVPPVPGQHVQLRLRLEAKL